MNQTRRSDSGVTLVEVLVSLAIFAVIGLAGLTVLDTVARTGERTEGRKERLIEIDRAFLLVRRDLAQLAAGETRLTGSELQFRRLQTEGSFRVIYRFEDETLHRDITLAGATSVPQKLLTGVTGARWRLLDDENRWVMSWPPDGVSVGPPRAVELRLDVTRAQMSEPQTVTRIFLLPAGQTQ